MFILFTSITLLAILNTGQTCSINCSQGGKYANPKNKNSYIDCQNGKGSLVWCPPSGDGFTRKIFNGKDCIESYACPLSNSKFRHPHNEAFYWNCQNGVANLERCPFGLVFDGHSQCIERFDCPELTGYFPISNNKTQYYECCYGEPTLYSCPKGYQFDSDLRCVETFVCPQLNGRFRNIRKENQYYECIDGVPILRLCPEKYIFDGIGNCMEKFDCPLSEGNFVNPHDETNRTYYLCRDSQPILTQCPHHYVFYGQECDEPFRCPKPEGRFKHPRNDTKYYMCENSHPFPHLCAVGLHFDESKGSCARPWQCPSRFGKFRHPDNTSLYYLCDNGVARPVYCPRESYFDGQQCVLNFKCPQMNGMFRHPTDANKYYYCRDGTATLQECPIDYVYNEILQTCTSRDEIFVCPQPNGNFQYPNNDRVYYVCEENRPHMRKCSANQKFDRNKQRCVDIRTPISEFDCPQPDGLFRDRTNDSRFYHCRDNIPHLRECGLNRRFDERVGNCVEITDGFQCPQPNGMFSHPTHSSRFYHCVNGVPTLRQCPSGQVFDVLIQNCVRPSSAFVCPETEGVFAHPTNESRFYYCRQNTPHLSECPSKHVFDPYHKTCVNRFEPPSPPVFRCPQPNGLFPDPYSRGKYYQCVNDVPYPRDCGPQQVFDPTYQRCLDRDQDLCQCPQPNGLFAYPYNKRRYYLCRQNICQIRECSVEEVFDAYSTRCVSRTADSGKCRQPNGLFRHETNSSRFYHCRDGRPELRECQSYQIFDEDTGRCIPWSWPNNFYCPLPNGLFTNPQNQSEFFECCKGQPTLRSCPHNQIFNGQHCISEVIYRCENNYPQNQCFNGHRYQYSCPFQYGSTLVYNGYRCVQPYHCPNAHGVETIVNPVHNHQYYRCVNGNPSLNTCSRGYTFDPRRGCCVYEQNNVPNGYYDHGLRPQVRPHQTTNLHEQSPVRPDVIPGVAVIPESSDPQTSYLPFVPPPPKTPVHPKAPEVIEVEPLTEVITLPEAVAQRKEPDFESFTRTPPLRGDIDDYANGEKDEEEDDDQDYGNN